MKHFVLGAISLGLSTGLAAADTSVQSCNRTVTFDAPPERAVSNDVNLTEMMLVLGLADRMVGYTGISGWKTLDEDMRAGVDELPELSAKYPSKEVIVGADADFFFAGWNYGMKVGGEVTPETLAPFGVKVYELTESCTHIMNKAKASIDDMYADLINLGAIFDVDDKAAALVDGYKADLAAFSADLKTGEPVRAFVYDSGEDAPFTAGLYAMPTALIEAAGGTNVMNGFEKSWGTVTWEEVVEQNPEVIVIVNYGEVTAEEKREFMMSNPAFAELEAVKNDRFVTLEYVEATPGPRNIQAIKTLAKAFWANCSMSDAAAQTTPTKLVNMSVLAVGGLVALLTSLSIAVSVGAVSVPAGTVWGVLANKLSPALVEQTWSQGREAIVWNIRFPRALLAMMVGAGLAIVGASLQAVTRNPLADPHLLGISSGGAFGAIFALLHSGLFLGLLTVPLLAFFGSLAATLIVLGVSRLADASSADRLVLAGVAVSFIIMAAANGLIFLGDARATHTVVFWMLGGLGLAQWDQLIYPLVILILCGAWLTSRTSQLNAMTIGDETAATLGIAVARFRLIVFVVGALITGVMVAFSGIIGFVGLMVPHIARMLVGGDYTRVLPASALIGAIFLLWADIAARTVMAPEDMPIGIVTGLVGGVFFVWLLGRRSI